MGSEIVQPREGENRSERSESPNWDSEVFKPGADSRDSTRDASRDMERNTQAASDSAQAGNVNGLKQSVENAFESANGRPEGFNQFGKQLQEDLANKGYDVKYSDDSIALRRQGSDTGVQIKVDGELDFSSGKIKGDAQAQSIDWKTGKAVEANPDKVLENPEAASEKPDSMDALKKLFGDTKPQEGGGKFKPAPSLEKPFDADKAVDDVQGALKSGNFDDIKKSIESAYEGANGNPNQFKNFGAKLQQDLAKQGYDVRFGENSLALHKQGEDTAVDFQLNGDLDVSTNKFDAKVTAQAYDWNTKENVQKDPADAFKGEDKTDAPDEQVKADIDISGSDALKQLMERFGNQGNNGLEASEGGGKFNARPSGDKPYHPEQAVTGAETALKKGDFEGVKNNIEKAFEDAGGNPEKFKEFGKQLQEKLARQGYDVKFGDSSVALHKQGSDTAVDFQLSGDLDVATNKFDGKVTAQAYDWNTKKDIQADPAEALKGQEKAEADVSGSDSFQKLLEQFKKENPALETSEGGGKFKPAPAGDNKVDFPEKAAANVAQALRDGGYEGVKTAIEKAFSGMNGNLQEFEKFGEQLKRDLSDKGFDVKQDRNRLSLHRQGSDTAVEFKVDGDLDVNSGKFTGRARAQAYDWNTKQDLSMQPEQALDLNQSNALEKSKPTADQLGDSYDAALLNGDFSKFNKNFAESISNAYDSGGMAAVRDFERNTNASVEAPGKGPVVMQEGDKLQVYNAEVPSDSAKQSLQSMSPDQLAKRGYVRHPEFGILKIDSLGPSVRLKQLSTK